MFTEILTDMGLTPSTHDPCMFDGVLSSNGDPTLDPTSVAVNISNPQETRQPIFIGIYVDDFVFYSKDPAEEERFK